MGKREKIVGNIIIGIAILIFLWVGGLFLTTTYGGPDSEPYITWENMDEMMTVLGDDYLYPTYLPAYIPRNKIYYYSWLINIHKRARKAKNFEEYRISYDNQADIESSSAKDWLRSVYIRAEADNDITSIEEKMESYRGHSNDTFLYVLKDSEVKLEEKTVFLSAYYRYEDSTGFNIDANYNYRNVNYSLSFDFVRSDDNETVPLDKKYDTYEEDIIQYVKDEINLILKSMATYSEISAKENKLN